MFQLGFELHLVFVIPGMTAKPLIALSYSSFPRILRRGSSEHRENTNVGLTMPQSRQCLGDGCCALTSAGSTCTAVDLTCAND